MKHSVHGSYWWKCDFHNHTPGSNDYGRNPAEKASMTAREWLLGYMRAGIDCVGITDHNTGKWVDILKDELVKMEQEQPQEADYRTLCLFPGVEISVQGGIHLLALFDPSKKSQDIFSLLGAVGMDAEGYGNSDTVTNDSLGKAIEKIVAAGGIAIPAHVDCKKGLFTVWGNAVSTKKVLSLNKLLAVEIVDDAFILPDVYQKAKVHLANIVGSDSHSPDKVGSAYTWVKMQTPNIEALKLALHDGEDGVIRAGNAGTDPNEVENRFFIYSLKITTGMKAGNGKPLVVNFSPWMTSIIGGRGSGKSSVFNFIRIPFNKVDNLPSSIKADYDKFAREGSKASEGMLKSNTVIEVEFFKEGRQLKLEYSAHNKSRKLFEKNSDGDWETSSDSIDPVKHYKIDIFSQKQLYELASEPNHILSLIDGKFNKIQWQEKLDELEANWMASRQKERELLREVKNEHDVKEALNAVNSRLETYEGTEKALLLEFKECSSAKATLKESVSDFDEIMSQMRSLTELCSAYDLIPEKTFSNQEEVDNLYTVDSKIKAEFSKIVAAYTSLEAIRLTISPEIKASPWYSRQAATTEKYQKLVDDLRAAGQDANIDYEALLKEKRSYEDKLSKLDSLKQELVEAESAQKKIRTQVYAHHKELRSKRKAVIAAWDAAGDKRTISVQVDELRDYASSELSFRNLIAKPGAEFEGDILRKIENEGGIDEVKSGLLFEIMNWQAVDDRWTRLSHRIDAFIDATEDVPNKFGIRFIKHKERIKATTPEMLDRLMIWVPEDRVVLKLLRDGREEDIDTGSAGQKTAGMLSLLLTLDSGPLLIDQPEDDLDTRLIGELLVANFKLLKQKRQIIVVTHNPNIAVNGSSEKIVQMEFKHGQIVKMHSGALQDKGVRGAVCEIMEGGKDALDKRYYRISQALSTMS
ncbi:MAG TPA: AAA family ATPase [Hymenobacter sp.]|uniref:TrlF family AAA-like ATPase n=1 Tax=Hymenobacter sp. TaxID=1898978 RepID=UPI002D7FA164|nr:AAA family ATPase [Hymenobacter sp.]HET9502961.1 AAA family ATPase [Hymenobacter sp.]